LISDSGNPKRKYRHTLEAVQVAHGHWAGVNTGRPNQLVAELIDSGALPELGDPTTLKREVKYGDSRFDIALDLDTSPTYIEVKNVTLGAAEGESDSGHITFPDSVTERGQKHLRTLMQVVEAGQRAVLFFCVQHTGAKTVGPADDIDPVYGQLLREAAKRGVEIHAWKAALGENEFRLIKPLKVVLD
jgi:sugar fermentation stimulation protein A